MQLLQKQLQALAEPPEDLSPAQERTRNRLLGAAADHFARFGYRRTNIADIADEAGVGKGTVYLYFDSKIELLSACVAQEKLQLIPELEEAMERPPAERLEAYLQIAIRFVLTAPLSGALMKGDRELSAALADAAEEGLTSDPSNGVAFIAGLVADAAPGLAEHERDLNAQVLATVAALPVHLSTMHALVPVDEDDFATTYARILARGVAAHRPGTENR